MKKVFSYLYLLVVLGVVSSCQGQQKQNNKSAGIKETTDSNAKDVMMDIENQSAEDSLTEILLTDLQTRVFPTEEEIGLWRLITEEGAERDNLPLLGRALVRAFLGTDYWGEDGEPELKNDSKAFCPVYIDMTGDYGWYILYPDSIWVSSKVSTYSPNDILKGGLMNPWCSVEGDTKGITLNFKLDVSTRRLDGISLNNGYCHTEEQWNSHGRVAKMQLLVDGVPYKTTELEDTPFRQMLPIDSIPATTRPEPVVVTLQILEVYPGTRYNDVAIGNLYFSSEDSRE